MGNSFEQGSAVVAAPSGDSIAKKVEALHQGGSLAEIARDLTDAHAHRPGKWQQDLDTVNQRLHDQGILPGIDIVGVRGQDLVTRDGSGKIEIYDSTDLNNHHAASFGGAMEGRATFKPDGSGEYTVAKGDNLWTISRDVLKAQGVSQPTDNQIANYEKELAKLNDTDLSRLHPGDKIQLPASTRGGDGTEFATERAQAQETKELQDASDLAESAKAVIEKLGDSGGLLAASSISQDEIAAALESKDLSDGERKALKFMQDNWSTLVDDEGDSFGRSGAIWGAGIDQWLEETTQSIELDRMTDFGERKAG